MINIAIITAMQSEFDAVKSLYHFEHNDNNKANYNNKAEATVHHKNIVLKKSGMGKVNAALAAQEVIENGADIVINTGLAGGIDNILQQGDIVLADKICYHDVWCGEPNAKGQVQDLPLYYRSPEPLISKISEFYPEFKVGLTVTGDQFLTDIGRLKEIKRDFPSALAVDMESAAIAQTCYLKDVPFISLRIISDVVGKEEQMEQYQNFWKNVPNKAAQMLDKIIPLI